MTAEDLYQAASGLPEIGSQIPDPKGMLLTPEQRTARAAAIFGTALAVLLLDNGWRFSAKPGDQWLARGEERVIPREVMNALSARTITAEAWAARCQSMGISGLRLAGVAQTAAQSS